MAKPFVSAKLENRILRNLLIASTDSKELVDEVIRNIGYAISSGITSEYFYTDFKQWIFQQIIDHYVKHTECLNKETIEKRIKKKYTDEDLENKLTICETIFDYDIEYKVFKVLTDELKNKYSYRVLLKVNMEMNTALEDAYKSDKNDASAILRNIDDSTKKLLLVNDKYKVIEEDVFHNLDGYFESVRDRRENPEKHKGITSGFEKIDELTGGWKPGELIFVLGRPGHGKSVLLLNFGYHAYMDRCNVIYITIEMPIEQQRNRFYSILTKTNYSHLKSPHLLSDESVQYYEKRIREEQAKHNNYFWFIDAPENCTASFLESRVSAFESTTNKKCDLLLIDPIYLMRPMIKTEDPVGTISWDLKLLARKMKIPVICASQFNRESAKKHEHGKGASTSDAAFSDKLSQNADAMIGIINDMNGRAKLQFPKTRDAKQIKQLFFHTRFDVMSFEYDYDSEDSNN